MWEEHDCVGAPGVPGGRNITFVIPGFILVKGTMDLVVGAEFWVIS